MSIFKHYSHTLGWFRSNNPARQRFPNLLEHDRAQPPPEQFGGCHPVDIYASILAALCRVVYQDHDWRKVAAFELCELGCACGRQHPIDVARRLGVQKRTVYRWLDDFRDGLEREFKRRKLLD